MKKKGNKTFIKIAISLFVAILLFLALTSLEGSMLQKYEKEKAVLAKQDITVKTLIDKNNLNSYFYETEVDNILVTDHTITDINSLVGKIMTIDVSKNQVVTDSFIRSSSVGLEDIKDPAEISFSVNNLANAVNGQIRTGDIVDILIYNNTTAESEYIMKSVHIKEALTSDGVTIANNDTSSIATSFIVVVERSDAEYFINMLNKGQVYVTYPKEEQSEIRLNTKEENDARVEAGDLLDNSEDEEKLSDGASVEELITVE